MTAVPVEVWACPICGFVYESPIPVTRLVSHSVVVAGRRVTHPMRRL